MKRLVYLLLTFLLTLNFAYCGQLQVQYEKQNAHKMNAYYESYKKGSKYMYNRLNKLYNESDEANFQYLIVIKRNFKNKKNWKFIDVDDYTYNFLDEANKEMILFNNMVYYNR